MRGVSERAWPLAALALCLLLPLASFAQTGKVTGTAVDAQTGDPLIAANIVIEGTSRGAATDLDGFFAILAVPPGTYSITASYAGYAPVTITDVAVNIDVTTSLEFELQPTAIQMEAVTVVYKKPVVDVGTTSKMERITSESLEMNVQDDVTAMLLTAPGFKIDEEGKIHIRGGRDTEASFVVEGLDVRDPITGETLPLNLSSLNIEEIQILTGGMSAEYGRAQSGIVNISTPEGSPDEYNGTLQWETDQLTDAYSFNEDRLEAAIGGPIPFTGDFLDRPITFYATANGLISDTYTSLGVDYDAQDYIGTGLDLPRRQYNDFSASLKLAYDIGNGQKISAYLQERTLAWDLYGRGISNVSGNYGWQYKHNLQNLPQARDKRTSIVVDYVNQVSDKTVLNFSLGRQVINASTQPRGKNPGEFTLEEEIEQIFAFGDDRNRNGRWDQDADGDGVVHSDTDELANDSDQNNFLDGFYDANRTSHFEGDNEGYEDLNMNGRWDRGEDWIDLNGNGVYDYAEPWTDRQDPVTGANNVGVYDPWDPFIDLNGNGVWDSAEPQLAEQDLNNNGRWDGERFQDANNNGVFDRWEPFTDLNNNGIWDPGEPFEDYNGNGVQDDGEGYDDQNMNGRMDQRDLVNNGDSTEELQEPFWDGDIWYDTGEPFVDLPDPLTGLYNGTWDQGEPFTDLPTSNTPLGITISVGGQSVGLGVPTLNGAYDEPDRAFDEFELFTYWSGNTEEPVGYTYDPNQNGQDWMNLPAVTVNRYGVTYQVPGYLAYDPQHSTWINRTIDDKSEDGKTPIFDPPNFTYDEGVEQFVDYNGNGVWNGQDLFLNPGTWDANAIWTKRRTETYTFKFSWQSQVHKFHELKAGTEVKYYVMSQQYIEQPDQIYSGQASVDPNQPWPEIGSVRDFWEYKPWEGAVYFKDKMEFEGLIVDIGVRTDFILHDKEVVDEQQRRFEAGEPGAVDARRTRFQLAPRLGISHPITEQSKLYFNYGHFYQLPTFFQFYKSTTTNLDEGVVGNPNLKFQRTVTYELGVHTQLDENLSFQIAGYYRDIYDQISTIQERQGAIVVTRYINLDYGRARGFELKIDRKFANHYQFNINYDFSYAYGKSSGALDDLVNYSSNVPVNYDEHPLDWDETHRVTMNGAVMYPKGDYPNLFGFRLPDYWMMAVQWQFGSGRPYTPSEYSTGMNEYLILENSARMPWTETTSLRFEKYFDFASIKWILGMRVNNLWNKQNVRSIYQQTGSPDIRVHPLNPDYDPTLHGGEFDQNPRNYGPGRQIFVSIGMEF